MTTGIRTHGEPELAPTVLAVRWELCSPCLPNLMELSAAMSGQDPPVSVSRCHAKPSYCVGEVNKALIPTFRPDPQSTQFSSAPLASGGLGGQMEERCSWLLDLLGWADLQKRGRLTVPVAESFPPGLLCPAAERTAIPLSQPCCRSRLPVGLPADSCEAGRKVAH